MKRQATPGLKMNSRILVITGSNDTAAQYINYMNVFFTAQVRCWLCRSFEVCLCDSNDCFRFRSSKF